MICLSQEWNRYEHTDYEIKYSKNWSKKQSGSAIIFLSPKENKEDIFLENVNIMIQDLGRTQITLEEYTDITKKQIGQNDYKHKSITKKI